MRDAKAIAMPASTCQCISDSANDIRTGRYAQRQESRRAAMRKEQSSIQFQKRRCDRLAVKPEDER